MCWLLKGVIPTSRKAYFLMYQDVQPNQPERADHNILYHVAKRLVFLNFRADGVRITVKSSNFTHEQKCFFGQFPRVLLSNQGTARLLFNNQ